MTCKVFESQISRPSTSGRPPYSADDRESSSLDRLRHRPTRLQHQAACGAVAAAETCSTFSSIQHLCRGLSGRATMPMVVATMPMTPSGKIAKADLAKIADDLRQKV